MNTTNTPLLMPSNWLIVEEEPFHQLLHEIHAAYHPDKDQWIRETTERINAIRHQSFHTGDYLILTEDYRLDDNLYLLSLSESLDWTAFETIWLRVQSDVPPQWSEEWRDLACENLHELVLKQHKELVRQAANEAWENYWREVQKIEREKKSNPDSTAS